MGTLTIGVADETEKKFRAVVERKLGSGKGKLGLAVTQAMEKWITENEQKTIAEKELAVLSKGFSMGQLLYKKREDLYDR